MLFFEYSIRRQSSLISPEEEPVTTGSSASGETKGFGTSKTFIGLITVREFDAIDAIDGIAF